MTKRSGLEYCVRDKHRTVVVRCRPVEDLLQVANEWVSAQAAVAAQAIQNGVIMSGIANDRTLIRLEEAESRFRALLGLGEHDADPLASGEPS